MALELAHSFALVVVGNCLRSYLEQVVAVVGSFGIRCFGCCSCFYCCSSCNHHGHGHLGIHHDHLGIHLVDSSGIRLVGSSGSHLADSFGIAGSPVVAGSFETAGTAGSPVVAGSFVDHSFGSTVGSYLVAVAVAAVAAAAVG